MMECKFHYETKAIVRCKMFQRGNHRCYAFHWKTISGQRKWSRAMVDFNSINLRPGKWPAAPGLITVWPMITLITNRNNLERRVASRWHFEQQFSFQHTL